MGIIKGMVLILIFLSSAIVGILIAKKYANRVRELKEMRNSLNIFKTKIKYTYEPIPEIFKEIGLNSTDNVSSIYIGAVGKMKTKVAGQAWIEAIEESSTNLNEEDVTILKSLSKLLGKTDVEGQISEIELVNQFMDVQIEKAEQEKSKNEKLYKTLGVVAGLAITIVLI